MKFLVSVCIALFSLSALAVGNNDGSQYPACAGVVDKCLSAPIEWTNPKGKVIKGYQPGMHKKNGDGLWIDCVGALAKGETVEGVTGVTQEAAQACRDAKKADKEAKKAAGDGGNIK